MWEFKWPLPSHLVLSPHIPTKVTSRCLRSLREPDTCSSRKQTPPATTWVSPRTWKTASPQPGNSGDGQRAWGPEATPGGVAAAPPHIPGPAHLVALSCSQPPPGAGIRGSPGQGRGRMCHVPAYLTVTPYTLFPQPRLKAKGQSRGMDPHIHCKRK